MDYSMGDVETQENAYPILYLTRRFMKDSGGAGRYRGGVGSLVAIVPYGTPGMRMILVEDRRLIPTHGCVGGYPGGSNQWWVGRNIDVPKAISQGFGDPEKILPTLEMVPPITTLDMGSHDMFVLASCGGGGFGDPVNRDPQKVATDVKWGFVSLEKARRLYGVVLDPPTYAVNVVQTLEERNRIRRSRGANVEVQDAPHKWLDSDYTVLREFDKGVAVLCARCLRVLSDGQQDWQAKVFRQDLFMDQTGMPIPTDERVVLRQYICTNCGAILDSEVTLRTM
jgi:N-methylhydantoinase B